MFLQVFEQNGGELAVLNRQNFQGPIYVECEHDWEDNLEDVKYAVEYLEKLN